MKRSYKLSNPVTDTDVKLLNTKCNLYRSLWSCNGFLTGEPNINDALDGMIIDQRIEIENRMIESHKDVWKQLEKFSKNTPK